MRYTDRFTNKKYNVDEIPEMYKGAIINVNGTSITDIGLMGKLTNNVYMELDNGSFSVFVDGDEIVFKSFEEAYNCAMNEQKDTFWL